MTAIYDQVTTHVLHPLEPLSESEVETAVAIARASSWMSMPNAKQRFRFPCVTLNEPPKSEVLNFQPGNLIERSAFLILLDNETGATYEAIVSLNAG
ncbi:MAG: primary-amine oxidase, partial [Waterburya sp.]